jgi:hypothetical protein
MTRFRMLLIVVVSAMAFTFVGPFLYRAVGADSPVGSCSPVGDSSPVGDTSPVGDCSPPATGLPTRISNSLSGGGQTGPVITVPAGTAVTDQATLSADDDDSAPGGSAPVAQVMAKLVATGATGPDLPNAGGTVTYTVYALNPHQWGWDNHSWGWGWHWNQVASGGTVTVTGGVVPPSNPVTLGAGVYAWQASYSGDDTYAPSHSHRGSGIQIVQRDHPDCWGDGGWSCGHPSGDNGYGNGHGNDDGGGNSSSGGGGNSSSGGGGYFDHGGNGSHDTYAGYYGHDGGNSSGGYGDNGSGHDGGGYGNSGGNNNGGGYGGGSGWGGH